GREPRVADGSSYFAGSAIVRTAASSEILTASNTVVATRKALQRTVTLEADTAELVGCAKERPVGLEEAQDRRYRRHRIRTRECRRNGLDLPAHLVGHGRAVAATDGEAVVRP